MGLRPPPRQSRGERCCTATFLQNCDAKPLENTFGPVQSIHKQNDFLIWRQVLEMAAACARSVCHGVWRARAASAYMNRSLHAWHTSLLFQIYFDDSFVLLLLPASCYFLIALRGWRWAASQSAAGGRHCIERHCSARSHVARSSSS